MPISAYGLGIVLGFQVQMKNKHTSKGSVGKRREGREWRGEGRLGEVRGPQFEKTTPVIRWLVMCP